MHLYDAVDQDELAKALANNHVREQTHPTEPLAILNYTELCVITPGGWNPTTLACRGLIYRTDTAEVVARGFVKFFNHGQDGAPVLDMDASVLVTDKKDGSLGIIYPVPSGGVAVATRGSFASEQAIHATALLNARYPEFRPDPATTTLVEIVYPANRIVLDYAGLDDLILLGGQPLDGGWPIPPATMHTSSRWPGPVTETLMVGSFAEALALPNRVNAEGVVVHDLLTGALVKIKQADYVELHRIVTNLTARKVHDFMLTGGHLADFIAPLPDEFHTWVQQVAEDITALVDAEDGRLQRAFDDLCQQVVLKNVGWRPGDRQARKDFAALAVSHSDPWAMFALLDGRDLRPELLKRARPEPFVTPTGRTYTEDNA
ncbi:MAG: RNA ligase [Actinoplanes sp.]